MSWTTEEIEVVERHLPVDPGRKWKQRLFPASPRGVTQEGLQDYRGYPLTNLVSFDILEVDFSRSRSAMNVHGVDCGIQLNSCRCRRVRFERSGHFHSLHGIFDSCSFDHISTDHCGFPGLYRDCTFRGANLRRAVLVGDFVRCTFEGANLLVDSCRASFEECRFSNCKMSPLFDDICAVVGTGAPVTFSVIIGGIRLGEVVRFFNPMGLMERWGSGSGG
jgi:hypothetical protein